MVSVSINEYFNNKNLWTKRLMGDVQFQKNRTEQQIEEEYNLDKYGKLVDFDFNTVDEYKAKEFELAGLNPITGQIYIAKGDEIFRTSVANARKLYYDLIQSTIKEYTSNAICELGCGYGFNLSYLGNNVYGGDYCKNAVKIGKKIGLDISEFNYYTADDYNFIKPNSTIFTTHSIEQIPDATIIIENLVKQKNKINFVVHFEPTILEERTNLIGIFRNKYLEINDYNRNLISVLRNRNDIEILKLETDIFGLVPLNTTNLIVWKFRE